MSKNRNPKVIDGTCRVIDEGKPEGGENVNQEQEQKNQENKDVNQQPQKPVNDEEVGFFKKHKNKFIVAGAGLAIAAISFWFGNWTGSRSDDDGDHYLPFPEDDDEEPSDFEEKEEE